MVMKQPAIDFPRIQEIVTREVLRWQGLNATAFSGSMNPSMIYRQMREHMSTAFQYYRETEELDTCISSSLEVRRILVTGRPWQVISADESEGQAQLYRDEAAAFLTSIPGFGFVLEELCNFVAYGYVVCEIMWANGPEGITVEKIIGRPQEFFDFRVDFIDPPLGDLRFLPDMVVPGVEVPQEKFLVATHKPRNGDRRGLPLMRRLFWPSWFKRQGLRLDLQFLEKPRGTVAIGYTNNATADEKSKALAAAEAIVNEIAVAVPAGLQVVESLLSTTRLREGKDYQTMIDYLDSEMTRLILGQTLATRGSENQRGTQALGNVHQDLLFDFVKSDAREISTVVDEQLLGPWLLWTFGPQTLDRSYRPHFSIDCEDEENTLEQARFLKEARGLVDIPLTFAREKLQIPAPEEGEALVNSAMVPVELTGLPSDGESNFGPPPPKAKGKDEKAKEDKSEDTEE
jgi:phage gp29-like protein